MRCRYGRENYLVVLPSAHEAEAALTLLELAFPRADVALDAPVVEPVPVAAGHAFDDVLHDLVDAHDGLHTTRNRRSDEHTSELQSLMRISYAVFCLHKKKFPVTT